MFDRWILIGAASLVGLPLSAPLDAQDWRDVTSYRQRADETRLDVKVRYGAGRLRVEPGQQGELYRVGMRYDADVFKPITEFRAGRLEVGVEGSGKGVRLRNNEAGQLNLGLSAEVPLELDMDFGAVEADLELGGLRLRSVQIQTGASQTRARFSRPNPDPCDRFKASVGAAAFEVSGLANANCARVTVDGGVGDMTLDFGGAWRRDVDVEVNLALGSLTLSVPEDIGVRVDRKTFLSGFDAPGFIRRDGVYYSENWERATRRLSVDLTGAFGSAKVRWTPSSP